MSAMGIAMAIYQRNKTGKGQCLDASLYGAQLYLAAPYLQSFLAGNKQSALQQSRKQVENGLWNLYPTSGKWVYICEENNDGRFAALCQALGGDLVSDERFSTEAKRVENNVALIAAIDAITCRMTDVDLLTSLADNGIVHSPVNNYADVVKDEQAWQNNYFMKAYCEEVKREVEIRGLPVTLSKTPGEVNALGPQLGQDTELLMMDLLEYEWDEIEELKAVGAIP